MATMTAQMLIGSGHHNHGGIEPKRYPFLSEYSRLAWLLVEENLFQTTNREKRVVWIPTVDDMLEDAFLMIALHVVKDQELVQMAKSFSRVATSHRLELSDGSIRCLSLQGQHRGDHRPLETGSSHGSQLPRMDIPRNIMKVLQIAESMSAGTAIFSVCPENGTERWCGRRPSLRAVEQP